MIMDRKLYIGGTDCAPILGLSRWRTGLQVWAEKTGQIVPVDISGKMEVKLGTKLEATVAELFTEETGKEVQRANLTIFHPKYEFLGANVDRKVIGERAILECKTTSAWKYKEWEGEDIPIEYILQVMHYLAVTGAEKGYIACLIGNHKFVWKEILRDEKMIADIVKREVAFWNDFIVPRVMPAQISSLDSDILQKLYPQGAPASQVQLSDDANKIIESIEAMNADLKALEGQVEQGKNELKAMIGEHEIGVTGNYKVTWKNQITRRLSVDILKAELPHVYEKYSAPTNGRVLRIIPTKGGK